MNDFAARYDGFPPERQRTFGYDGEFFLNIDTPVQQIVIFMMTVRPGLRNREAFQTGIGRIVARRAGGAAFRIIYLTGDLAVLRGVVVGVAGTTTDEGLADYLTACMDGQAEAGWNVRVTIAARS